MQPSGSFKYRGISRVLQAHAARLGASEARKPHVITSSGGNAGLAAATAARALEMPCTVFCPTSVEDYIVEQLRAEGAEVVQAGAAWDICDQGARKRAQEIEADMPGGSIYVHPFEGEDLVAGHSSMVKEIYRQLAQMNDAGGERKPDMIVCSVGGGGLLAGVLTGIQDMLQSSQSTENLPHVVAAECIGADSFSQSYRQGSLKTLPAITSAATSLGALTSSQKTLDLAKSYAAQCTKAAQDSKVSSPGGFSTVVMPDRMAAYCAWQFAKDSKLIVELACSASLAPVYFAETLLPTLLKDAQKSGESESSEKKNIVIIVCGGSKVSAADLERWRKELPDASAALVGEDWMCETHSGAGK